MSIQIRFNDGFIIQCEDMQPVFMSLYKNEKDIQKISFENPKTQKSIHLLYDDNKNIWIQTPLNYNTRKYKPVIFKNITEENKKIIASLNEMDSFYEPYKEYTKDELIKLLSDYNNK